MLALRSALHRPASSRAVLGAAAPPAAPPASSWSADNPTLSWALFLGAFAFLGWSLMGGGARQPVGTVFFEGRPRDIERVRVWLAKNGHLIASEGTDLRTGREDIAVDTFGTDSATHRLRQRAARRFPRVRVRAEYGGSLRP